MFRKSFSQFFALSLLALSLATLCMEKSESYTPQNTKFAFDFHDVVAQASPYRVFNGLFNRNMLPELNWALPYNTALALYNLPWVAYETAQLVYNKQSGERYYKLYKKYGYDRLAMAIITIANDLKAIDGTVAIIKELKDKGYNVDMASDIGTSFLQNLETRPDFMSILTLFNNKKSVDYLSSLNPVHKPSKQFFVDYLDAYNPNKMKVIFIDDKQKNVSASETAGMVGIHFLNPAQLREELVKRGILD